MFIVTMVLGLMTMVASLVYLVHFARSSRHDSLHMPAPDRGAAMARRIVGVHTRNREEELVGR